jgi:hypothetical protein
MTRRPEEDADVVCQQMYLAERDTWTIRLGSNKLGDRHSLAEAITLARDAAVAHSRPAWLLDETGYPLKPMLPWAL